MVGNHFLIFLPGIMGTELRYVGVGRYLELVDQPVWGEDFSAILNALAGDPNILRGDLVGEVLKKVSFRFFGISLAYGRFLEFVINDLGYKSDINFKAFGYDWRKDNQESAQSLAEFMRKRLREGVQEFKIIAHSMGGIVARLLFANPKNKDLLDRTTLFVQIGTPVRGSSKAFYTLKIIPEFNIFVRFIMLLKNHLRPKIYKDLMDSISTFASLYQLLPPETEQILVDENGKRLDALQDAVWSKLEDKGILSRAREVHRLIQKCPTENMRIVTFYGSDIITDGDYVVDSHFDVVKKRPSPFIGDGTVTIASAAADTPAKDRQRIRGKNALHDNLPNHDSVKQSLSNLLT